MKDFYQIRISPELFESMLELASMVEGLDLSGIIKKSVRWLNKGNSLPPSGLDDDLEFVKISKSGHCNKLVKVRDCETPNCSPNEFRRVLAYRVLDALHKQKKQPAAFKTDLLNGRDFVVMEV